MFDLCKFPHCKCGKEYSDLGIDGKPISCPRRYTDRPKKERSDG